MKTITITTNVSELADKIKQLQKLIKEIEEFELKVEVKK